MCRKYHIFFCFDSRKREVIFVCKNQKKRKGSCNARVRLHKQTGHFWKDGHLAHNHAPERGEQRRVAAVNAICQAAESSREYPRDMFDRIRAE